MIVTFISQCEKKSLNKTRRVLDSFANRIGNRTWQTPITDEGLRAVKKLLKKTATKNTAVACHMIKSRKLTKLEWIVGNRDKFNSQGHVPVNYTKKNIMNIEWENDWVYLPLIKSLTAIAALFHDWGKASKLFQNKLIKKYDGKIIGDPLRHEWISLLFFHAFVIGKTDEQWLLELEQGDFKLDDLLAKAKQQTNAPLDKLPKIASMVAWLIVTHHKLPIIKKKDYRGDVSKTINRTLKRITQEWSYENKYDEDDFNKNIEKCFVYKNGYPSDSTNWLKRIKKWAGRLKQELPIVEKQLDDDIWRVVLQFSRLSLMLGDHFYSSLESSNKNRLNISELNLFANTDNSGKLKQTLDEHLCGVAEQAIKNVHKLPFFEGRNQDWYAHDVKALKKKSTGDYLWQEKAVSKIAAWKEKHAKHIDEYNYGFFTVNIASTGKGKTFANAKIMRKLSYDGESLRYILALGLRTLTLQTGDEYKDRIGLDESELAVLIGSRAVLSLHNNQLLNDEKPPLERGSESIDKLLDNELIFDGLVPENGMDTLLKKKKDRQFLYAPVLSCTIDHIISATQTKKGGRYILPVLRIMSSDLVIDEIDDFTDDDLIAIGRLIHLTGMLGRKVMISSATIPPDLALGYYLDYKAGWELFSKTRNKQKAIGCAWVDEFNTEVKMIESKGEYISQHNSYIDKRIMKLEKEFVKRKAYIQTCDVNSRKEYFSRVSDTIIRIHEDNFFTDNRYNKNISIGVVRMANINPCIELTKHLLNMNLPEDTEIKTMSYHSQQLLIMRNAQEKHLDDVLKRKNGKTPVDNEIIQNHLATTKAKNVIFVLICTPVEELGRDHDFDWAIIEPSSYRSFIQLAGRVLRHRNKLIEQPNVAIMQFNIKAIENQSNDKCVFLRPGYESQNYYKLNTHDLNNLVNESEMNSKLDATQRIRKPKKLNPKNRLADLEHFVIADLLTNTEEKGPESMQGWISGAWWLTGLPQEYVKFRNSVSQQTWYLLPTDTGYVFHDKDKKGNFKTIEANNAIEKTELSNSEQKRLWLSRDYKQLLKQSPKSSNLEKAAQIYGEINISNYGNNNDASYTYNHQLGMYRGIL